MSNLKNKRYFYEVYNSHCITCTWFTAAFTSVQTIDLFDTYRWYHFAGKTLKSVRSVWYCSNATGYVRSANENGKSARELKFYHGGRGGGLIPIDKKKEHCRWNVNFTSEREWLMSKTQARSQKHYHYLQANYQ